MIFKKIFKFIKKEKIKKKKTKRINTNKKIRKKSYKKIRKIKVTKRPIKHLKKVPVRKEELIAKAIHYFSKIKVAVLKMRGTLNIGDKIHLKGYTTDFTQNVTSMQINHAPVKTAKKGQEIGLLVKNKVRHRDKIYKI